MLAAPTPRRYAGNTLYFRNMLVSSFERIQPFFNCG
jgi:hypothetical protein